MEKTLLSQIPMQLEVIVGSVKLTAYELTQVKPGTTFELDPPYRDLVEIQVNGRRVAYGQLLSMDDGSGRLAVSVVEINAWEQSIETVEAAQPASIV